MRVKQTKQQHTHKQNQILKQRPFRIILAHDLVKFNKTFDLLIVNSE